MAGATPEQVKALGAPTPQSERKTRPAPLTKSEKAAGVNMYAAGRKQLTYVDARFVMDRLDEAVGPENWQRTHQSDHEGEVTCGIAVRIGDEWVWKWDVGTESTIEEVKGSYSDAFKRAAVNWGIGRDLYEDTTTTLSGFTPTVVGVVPTFTQPIIPTPQAAVPSTGWVCPIHGASKTVPAGVSKRTNRPYAAFEACPVQGCDEKAPRTVRPARGRTPVATTPGDDAHDPEMAYVGMLGGDTEEEAEGYGA